MSAQRLESSCVISSMTSQLAAPVADAPADEAVRRLRSGAQVLHGAVGLGDELDHLPELAELRHDLARQSVFPVPGMPERRRLFPFRQCRRGSSTLRHSGP